MYLFLKDRFIHSKKNRRPKIVIFVAAAVFLFFSCRSESVVYSEWLMGTHCSIRFYGKYDPRLPKRCFDAIREIEQTISATDPQSEVSLLNQGEMHPFSPLLSELMGISYKAAAQFDGLFSPGLGRLTALWGFSGEAPRKPADDEIAEALRLSVLPPLKRAGNGTAAAFEEKPLCAFDFGAVGKGFASDAVKRLCKEANAVALINLGGNIQTVGEKPNGEPWIISVQSPLTVGPVSVGTLQLFGRLPKVFLRGRRQVSPHSGSENRKAGRQRSALRNGHLPPQRRRNRHPLHRPLCRRRKTGLRLAKRERRRHSDFYVAGKSIDGCCGKRHFIYSD